MEGGRGTIKGFKCMWEKTAWDEDFYERHGLRVMDDYNCARQGWPPAHWSSGSSSDEEDLGVQAAGHGEGNAVHGEGGNDAIADGNGNDNHGDYVPSDTESAA